MSKKHLLLSILIINCLALSAQGLFESITTESQNDESESKVNLTGYVRGSAYGGSDNFDFTNVFGEFALQSRLSRGKTSFHGDIRMRNGLFFDERQTTIEVKEAFAAYRGQHISFYLGNQIVSWGRTDGFNPTNNINPNDYFFLTPDPDDQLMSNFMARTKIHFTPAAELEIVVIPVFLNSNYRYDLFGMGDEAHFGETIMPEKKLENSSFGARMNFELPEIGFSLSYFHGYDPFYGFRVKDIEFIPDVRIDYIADFYKKNTVGLDFALPQGNSIIRGEIAYNLTEDYKENMHVPNPDISYVFGFERSFFDVITVFQYVGKYTLDYKELITPVLLDPLDPGAVLQYTGDMIFYESELFNRKIFHQQEEFNHAVMLSLSRNFAHEMITAQLTGYYNITSEEYLIRPDINWKLTDELTATVGASMMYGKENSVFAKAGKVLNGIFIGLKASF